VTLPHKRNLDEAVWVRDGEIAKKKSVDEREDSDVCAYAQGEREYCNGGEAGILAQRAQGVPEILPELAHDHSLQKRIWAGFSTFTPSRGHLSSFAIRRGVIFRFVHRGR
jgi:hypothetical protein